MRVELHLEALNILSCDHESCLWSLQERVTSRLFTLTRSVGMTVPHVVLITRPFLLAKRVGRTQVVKDTGDPPTSKIRNSLKSATDERLLMRYVISNSFYAHFHYFHYFHYLQKRFTFHANRYFYIFVVEFPRS